MDTIFVFSFSPLLLSWTTMKGIDLPFAFLDLVQGNTTTLPRIRKMASGCVYLPHSPFRLNKWIRGEVILCFGGKAKGVTTLQTEFCLSGPS